MNASKIKEILFPRPAKRDFIHIALVTLAGLCLIYYLTVGIYAGFGLSFLPVWPFIALFLLVLDRLRTLHKMGRIRIPRWAVTAFLILLSLALSFFMFVEICIFTGFASDAPENADYIIVLGAKVRGDDPSLALSYRIDAACDYLAANPGTVCIASGGQGDDEIMSEAACIRDQLIARGIAPKRILLEERSLSTSQNLRFSRELIGDSEASVVIVSNNFHIFRAKALARRCGIENVYGLCGRTPLGLLPHYLVREFATVVVDTLRGNTKF